MKKILSGLLALISLTLTAQTVTTSLSSEFKIREMPLLRAGNSYYRLDTDGPRFSYDLRKSLHGLAIVKYDTAMKELKQVPLEGGKKVFGHFSSRLISLNNRLLLFYYRLQENDDMTLYLSQIDTATGAVTYTEALRSFDKEEITYKVRAFTSPDDFQNELHIEFSSDRSRLVVVSAKPGKLFSCIIGKDGKATGKKLIDTSGIPGFTVVSAYLDKEGNRYISYSIAKQYIRGVYMLNAAGREAFREFSLKEGYTPYELTIKQVPRSQTVYLYADYHTGGLSEGICLAPLDGAACSIGPAQMFTFPEEFCKRAKKLGCGREQKGVYTVRNTGYQLFELADGTLAFIGTPSFTDFNTGSHGDVRTVYTGPVLYGMVKGGKAVFDMVPRIQVGGRTDAVIPLVKGNGLLCLYADKKNSIEKPLDYEQSLERSIDGLSLAIVTISSEGVMTARKKLMDNPEGKDNFSLSDAIWTPDARLVIPLFQTKITMSNYVTTYRQLMTLTIE